MISLFIEFYYIILCYYSLMINAKTKKHFSFYISIDEQTKEIFMPLQSTLLKLRDYIVVMYNLPLKSFDIYIDKYLLSDFFDSLPIDQIFLLFHKEQKKRILCIIKKENNSILTEIENMNINDLFTKEEQVLSSYEKLSFECKNLEENINSCNELERQLNNHYAELSQKNKEDETRRINDEYNQKETEANKQYEDVKSKQNEFDKLLEKIILNKMMEKQAITLINENKKLVSKLHWSLIELEHKRKEKRDLVIKQQEINKRRENEKTLIESYLSQKKKNH